MLKAQVSLPKWAAEHLEILKSELEAERGSPVSYGVAIGEALKVYRRERAARNPNPAPQQQPEPVVTNAAQTGEIDYSNYDDTTDYGPPDSEDDDDDDDDDDSPF